MRHYFVNDWSRHTVVCRAAKKIRAYTSVLFTRTKISPISAFCILKTIAPISTKFIYFMLYIYTTFHTKFERNRASSSRDIRSQKSSDFLRILFFLLRTKPEIISSRAKTIFSCFDFLQIWYTYRAIKDLRIQRFSWNSMPIRKSYTQFSLDFFQNFLSRLPNRPLTLSIWNFYQAFKYY